MCLIQRKRGKVWSFRPGFWSPEGVLVKGLRCRITPSPIGALGHRGQIQAVLPSCPWAVHRYAAFAGTRGILEKNEAVLQPNPHIWYVLGGDDGS